MFIPRGISNTAPPEPRSRMRNNPTLLFSWWCTCFSLVIILFRLGGRYVRIERLFREDKVMALSIIPLLLRMGLVHIVLTHGTNNVSVVGREVTQLELSHRELGSKLVLASRIFYALFVWTAKYTVSEFLKRLTEKFWKRKYDVLLRGIRGFLGVTFILVVIATLAECQPFDHYWQVSPDPGPRCRQGYVHLIVMGVTDIMTDILIIVFPIPIIIRSAMSPKRKFDLVMLFSMSIILIGITAARIPMVINHLGRQQYRSVFASGEILAATAVSNAVIIGSFLRDRGVKKVKKYKFGSVADSMERKASIARPTLTAHHWGSDEDLIRDMGIRLDPSLHASRETGPRPAPVAMPAVPEGKAGFVRDSWQFPSRKSNYLRDSEESDEIMPIDPNPSPTEVRGPRRNMSFFDVGGLLEESSLRSSTVIPSPTSTTSAQDWALAPRRGSRAVFHDLGGFLSHPHQTHHPRRPPRSSPSSSESYELSNSSTLNTNHSPARQLDYGQPPLIRTNTVPSLQDVGGLLAEGEEAPYHHQPPFAGDASVAAVAPPSPTSHARSSFPASAHTHSTLGDTSTPSLVDAGDSLREERPP